MRSAEKIDKAYASIKTGMTLMVNGKPCKERIQKPISAMPTSIYQSQNNFHTTWFKFKIDLILLLLRKSNCMPEKIDFFKGLHMRQKSAKNYAGRPAASHVLTHSPIYVRDFGKYLMREVRFFKAASSFV